MQVSSSSGKSAPASKGPKGPGKAKDPIQERKAAQLADEAQVWCAHTFSQTVDCNAFLPVHVLCSFQHTMSSSLFGCVIEKEDKD